MNPQILRHPGRGVIVAHHGIAVDILFESGRTTAGQGKAP